MADTKISALSAGTALAGTEEIPGVQSAATVKFTPAQIRTYVLASPMAITGGTVTSSTPIVDGAQTWNSGAVTFTALKINVTDTASSSTSALADLQVGGSSKFVFGKSGTIFFPASGYSTFGFGSGGGGVMGVTYSGSNVFGFTAFNYHTFAGTQYLGFTSGAGGGGPDIAMYRNAAGVLELNNGTAGTFRDLYARNVRTQSVAVASLVAAATAGAGARAFVNDSSVTTFGSTVSAGGANLVPVYSDGTNWKVG